ncbi:hypothetical protein R1flu_014578 [Riccia fluitans]|uniref:Amine oxidase domain-containing protein n=1 Tax=Riccia fluitans TaxID=41844 RepID=A0ABD1YJL7_9MARC
MPVLETSELGSGEVLYLYLLAGINLVDTDERRHYLKGVRQVPCRRYIIEHIKQRVPQQMVIEVGLTSEALLEETKKVREEVPTDISVMKALELVLERRPELRQEGLRHEVLQWYLCRMERWFATDADNISVQSWDEEEVLQGGHGLMVRGYAPVIAALSAGLDIRLNTRVRKVQRRVKGVKAVRAITEDGVVYEADAAVIAVPLGVLKADLIRFEPRLPDWKERTIRVDPVPLLQSVVRGRFGFQYWFERNGPTLGKTS